LWLTIATFTPVPDALHLRPVVLAADASEVVADRALVLGDARGQKAALARQLVEQAVVADDRVVEVEADEHR
jgi:hypothetical protein